MHTKAEIKQFLQQQQFIPSKKMGQNFLADINYQNKIITAAQLQAEDGVVEIGPGLGALTKHLVSQVSQVIAIELDKRLYDYLRNNIHATNLTLINEDVLKVDLAHLLPQTPSHPWKVVANLPYSISSKIICQLLASEQFSEIYILVQKEMAERICASVGSKDYNAFTCLLQMFGDVAFLLKIPPQYFVPAPEVDSVLVRITYHNKFQVDFERMGNFLKCCFQHKRKTLINNLSAHYSKTLILQHLTSLNIQPNIRSEQLTIEELYQLYALFEA